MRETLKVPERKRGRSLVAGDYALARPAREIKVHGVIARTDKTDGNSYAVSLYAKRPGEVDFVPLVTDARHDVLGNYREGAKAGQERSVCLQVALGEPLPAGTVLRVTYDSPNEMTVGIDVEVA